MANTQLGCGRPETSGWQLQQVRLARGSPRPNRRAARRSAEHYQRVRERQGNHLRPAPPEHRARDRTGAHRHWRTTSASQLKLYDTILGTLTVTPAPSTLAPTGEATDRFGANSPVLSVVIPLAPSSDATMRPDGGTGSASCSRKVTSTSTCSPRATYVVTTRLRSSPVRPRRRRRPADLDLDDTSEPQTPAIKAAVPAEVRAYSRIRSALRWRTTPVGKSRSAGAAQVVS